MEHPRDRVELRASRGIFSARSAHRQEAPAKALELEKGVSVVAAVDAPDTADSERTSGSLLCYSDFCTDEVEETSPLNGTSRRRPFDIHDEHQIHLTPLGEDVYWATTYSLICDVQELLSDTDLERESQNANSHIMRLAFTASSLALNYVLQVYVLRCAYLFVAAPAVHRVQEVYKKYHEECFDDDGAYNMTKWNLWNENEKTELCTMVFSRFHFLYCILALWWMACGNEFEKTGTMMKDVASVLRTDTASLRKSEHLMVRQNEHGQLRIERLTDSMRWTLYLLILIPKLLICCGLLWVGTLWLAGTDNFATLVLNAVALSFVLDIDNWIFGAMFPESFRKSIGHCVIVKPKTHVRTGSSFVYGAAYYVILLGGVWIYLSEWGQSIPYLGVLPGYGHDAACPKYWARIMSRPCEYTSSLRGSDCFPYGEDAGAGVALLPELDDSVEI